MEKSMLLLFLLLSACSTRVDRMAVEKAKKEIVQTEADFAAMAKEQGLSKAFSFFADSAAHLSRGTYVIKGKDSIRSFYLAPRYDHIRLEWKPDFVEVSGAADLGYTFGKYTFTSIDSTGHETSSKGIFHTVWKRQKDGTWRFVWD